MKVAAENLIKVGGMSHSNLKGDKTLTNSHNLAINQIVLQSTMG